MHKFYYFSTLLLSMAFSNHAVAGCGSLQVTGSNINTTLSNKTICTTNPISQEEHHADGKLWDYKTGLTTGVDPRKEMGTWGVSVSDNKVNYNYGSNPTVYSFTLFDNEDGSYTFCDGNTSVAEVTKIVGIGGGC